MSANKTARKGSSKRLRFEVFKRDGFRCQYCGTGPDKAMLHCDHIEPVALGGPTEMDNLVTACASCNLGKSAVPLDQIPQSLEERALAVAEREEQIAGYQAVMRQKRERIEDDAEEILELFCQRFRRDGISQKEFSSIKQFIEALGLHEVTEAVEIAYRRFPYYYRKAFLYFCGVCWRKIRPLEGGRE